MGRGEVLWVEKLRWVESGEGVGMGKGMGIGKGCWGAGVVDGWAKEFAPCGGGGHGVAWKRWRTGSGGGGGVELEGRKMWVVAMLAQGSLVGGVKGGGGGGG